MHVAAFGPPGTDDLTAALPAVVAALALVVWHRAWAWLLLAGALCAVPVAVHAAFGGGQDPLVLTLSACVPPLALVGVLGAVTLVSQAGRPEAGAALAGTAMVMWLTGPRVSTAIVVALDVPTAVLTVALVVGAIIGSVAAVTTRPPANTAPPWRVTAVAVVAVLAPPLLSGRWRRVRAAGRRARGARRSDDPVRPRSGRAVPRRLGLPGSAGRGRGRRPRRRRVRVARARPGVPGRCHASGG
ncbi:MAG TPA: hypothetical protein VHH15_12700 [Actinophytocola sp.]|nr:hypothetical protein [Actinophytocola sp.]